MVQDEIESEFNRIRRAAFILGMCVGGFLGCLVGAMAHLWWW